MRQEQPSAPRLERLLRKFDPGERDLKNRALGSAGEQLAFESERLRLQRAGRADLARKVRWVSQEDGDGAGYDVLSFHTSGAERLLEVKTTNGTRATPFLLTRTEYEVSEERPADFRIFRIFEFSKQPRLFQLQPPLTSALSLRPELYRASF
jgi:hypothetical protein